MQETRRFRFVSDSFSSHRWAPFVCLVLFGGILATMLRFVTDAINKMPDNKGARKSSRWWWQGACLASICWTGFVLVANHVNGPFHFVGVFLFTTTFFLVHFLYDRTIWAIIDVPWEERAVEYIIYMCLMISLCVFAVLVLLSFIFPDEAANSRIQQQSVSAFAEYIALSLYTALNVYVASVMTYISKDFQIDKVSNRWVRKTLVSSSSFSK